MAPEHESNRAGDYNPDDDQYPGSSGNARGRRMTGSGVVTVSEAILIATGDTNQQSTDIAYLSKSREYAVVWKDVSHRTYLPLVLRAP